MLQMFASRRPGAQYLQADSWLSFLSGLFGDVVSLSWSLASGSQRVISISWSLTRFYKDTMLVQARKHGKTGGIQGGRHHSGVH